MEIDKDLYAEIKAYCALNEIKVTPFINYLLKKAFAIEKYGEKPPIFKKQDIFVPSIAPAQPNDVIAKPISEATSESVTEPEVVKKKPSKRQLN